MLNKFCLSLSLSLSLESMCEMIVKGWYMFLCERSIGQFCTKLRDFRWYICPAKDVPMYHVRV